MKTLRDAAVGETVHVVRLHGEGAVKRRTFARLPPWATPWRSISAAMSFPSARLTRKWSK